MSYSPPTDEQLERFVYAILSGEARRRGVKINPEWGARMAMENPLLKAEWLRRHREFQEGGGLVLPRAHPNPDLIEVIGGILAQSESASVGLEQVPERYARRVVITEEGCWEWTGKCDRDGYGGLSVKGRKVPAHRFFFMAIKGAIPEGMTLDHLCHVRERCAGGPTCPHRRCVNPEHLAIASTRENTLRGNSISAHHARKTHCPQGHPYDEANTYVWQGTRHCRICAAAAHRRYKKKLAALAPTCRDVNGRPPCAHTSAALEHPSGRRPGHPFECPDCLGEGKANPGWPNPMTEVDCPTCQGSGETL